MRCLICTVDNHFLTFQWCFHSFSIWSVILNIYKSAGNETLVVVAVSNKTDLSRLALQVDRKGKNNEIEKKTLTEHLSWSDNWREFSPFWGIKKIFHQTLKNRTSKIPFQICIVPAIIPSWKRTFGYKKQQILKWNYTAFWLNFVIMMCNLIKQSRVVEKWHNSLLNWSPKSPISTIFSLSLEQGFHRKMKNQWCSLYSLC